MMLLVTWTALVASEPCAKSKPDESTNCLPLSDHVLGELSRTDEKYPFAKKKDRPLLALERLNDFIKNVFSFTKLVIIINIWPIVKLQDKSLTMFNMTKTMISTLHNLQTILIKSRENLQVTCHCQQHPDHHHHHHHLLLLLLLCTAIIPTQSTSDTKMTLYGIYKVCLLSTCAPDVQLFDAIPQDGNSQLVQLWNRKYLLNNHQIAFISISMHLINQTNKTETINTTLPSEP